MPPEATRTRPPPRSHYADGDTGPGGALTGCDAVSLIGMSRHIEYRESVGGTTMVTAPAALHTDRRASCCMC